MQSLLVLIRKVKTFIKLDNRVKLEFLQAFLYTGFYRAFILFFPFNKLRGRMGRYNFESTEEVEREKYSVAKRISWIVGKASMYTPWESKCLVQALVAQRMLSIRKVDSTIYLGVKKDSDDSMLAHAWVRCGRYYVTGGNNRFGYAIVARFTK